MSQANNNKNIYIKNLNLFRTLQTIKINKFKVLQQRLIIFNTVKSINFIENYVKQNSKINNIIQLNSMN